MNHLNDSRVMYGISDCSGLSGYFISEIIFLLVYDGILPVVIGQS